MLCNVLSIYTHEHSVGCVGDSKGYQASLLSLCHHNFFFSSFLLSITNINTTQISVSIPDSKDGKIAEWGNAYMSHKPHDLSSDLQNCIDIRQSNASTCDCSMSMGYESKK